MDLGDRTSKPNPFRTRGVSRRVSRSLYIIEYAWMPLLREVAPGSETHGFPRQGLRAAITLQKLQDLTGYVRKIRTL